MSAEPGRAPSGLRLPAIPPNPDPAGRPAAACTFARRAGAVPWVPARRLPGHRRPLPRPGAVRPFVSRARGAAARAPTRGAGPSPCRGRPSRSRLRRVRERRGRPRGRPRVRAHGWTGLEAAVRRGLHSSSRCPCPRRRLKPGLAAALWPRLRRVRGFSLTRRVLPRFWASVEVWVLTDGAGFSRC